MKILKEVLSYLIIILAVIAIREFVVSPVQVNGCSMQPTLESGEILLLYKSNSNIERFDVVVLNFGDEQLVKRIIGLPGDKIKYSQNKLYVNDELILDLFAPQTKDFDVIEVPVDEYFVLGDNRSNSKDSRMFGSILKDDIVGKTKIRIFPLDRVGFVE